MLSILGFCSESHIVFAEQLYRTVRLLGVTETGIADILLAVDVHDLRMTFGHHYGKELIDGLTRAIDLVVHLLDVGIECVALHLAEREGYNAVLRRG